jgi:hypothetical protein
MSYLKQIKYQLPDSDNNFIQNINAYTLPLNTTEQDYYPKTEFIFSNTEIPAVSFVFDNGEEHKVEIKNSTGQDKQSPHKYTPLEMDIFIARVKDFKLVAVDHTGFNLPWFESGIHPEILKLREFLKDKSLYHEFPKQLADEPWDFILPGTIDEISRKKVDYQKTRRPKIEIVSFPKSSTPLIQIDIQLDGNYEDLLKLFPEAIAVPSMRNLWVYIKNDYGIDICFVLNEVQEKDWSYYFENCRLT